MTFYISVEPTRFKDTAEDVGAPLIVRKGRHGRPMYTRVVHINGPCTLSYAYGPIDPLPDGTRAWIETEGPIDYFEEP